MPSSAAQRDIPPEIVYRADERPSDFREGAALLVDKVSGATSFDVVALVRKGTGISKVGHAGTLDPLATGLLIVLVARPATRLQEAFMHHPKTYRATIRLGEKTPSHDVETDVVERVDVSSLSRPQIESARDEYLGALWQIPPMYSAVKVDGERLYEKARRGETTERPPRRVRVDAFELIDWRPPDLRVHIRCSKGTYVRALARDLGADLGVGAHLTALRRLAIGPYAVENAWALDDLRQSLLNENPEAS